jgi:hypothetical protein
MATRIEFYRHGKCISCKEVLELNETEHVVQALYKHLPEYCLIERRDMYDPSGLFLIEFHIPNIRMEDGKRYPFGVCDIEFMCKNSS